MKIPSLDSYLVESFKNYSTSTSNIAKFFALRRSPINFWVIANVM
jgi:hypothetical protein